MTNRGTNPPLLGGVDSGVLHSAHCGLQPELHPADWLACGDNGREPAEIAAGLRSRIDLAANLCVRAEYRRLSDCVP